MEGIRIKNMRSLKDTGNIVLKDINVLVGNNSSGKSTFLRVFPLLKQSFIKRINGPILWAGEKEDDVDFGSFEETVNKTAAEKEIELEFDIEYNLQDIENSIYTPTITLRDASKRYNKKQLAKLIIGISEKDKKDIISKVIIEANNKKFLMDIVNNIEYLNGKEVKKLKKGKLDTSEEIMRRILWADKELLEESSILKLKNRFNYNQLFGELVNKIIDNKKESDLYGPKLWIEQEFGKFVLTEKIINPTSKIADLWEMYVKGIDDIKKTSRSMYVKEIKTIKIKEISSKDDEEINQCIDLIYINMVAKYALSYIYNYFIKVNYIKPVRAYAERYYRLKNLSVNDIDSDGKNLPIFINSLSTVDLKKFKDWTKENFGFTISTNQTEGHVSINIEAENRKVNLSDTGYGYSQLLPIITQLWVITSKNNIISDNDDKKIPIVFAVEQPELHLHPGLQAKLIDIIASVAKNHKGKFQFILETHSETIINRIGNLIYKNKLDKNSVNVILFDKKLDDENTQINISNYDKEGYLKNWPSGFFLVDEIK